MTFRLYQIILSNRLTLDCFCGIYYSMTVSENIPKQPTEPEHLQEDATANIHPKPELVHESKVPETDDPRYNALINIAKESFPEMEYMGAGEIAETLFPVLWGVVDPDDSVPQAKKDVIQEWSTHVFPKVLEEGSFREPSSAADVLAEGNAHLHAERRGNKDEARTDSRTGLGNARAFEEFKSVLDDDPERLTTKGFCYFDLNGLKDANDQLGNPSGDYLIKLTSEFLRNISDQLFAKQERKAGEGPQIFRISEGADDFVAVLPVDHAEEFAKFITQRFGHLTGEEKDREKGFKVLTPPTGVTISSGTEVDESDGENRYPDVVGYASLTGKHIKTGEVVSVKASLSVGVSKPILGSKNSTDELISEAFVKMKKNKDQIKETFPKLAGR